MTEFEKVVSEFIEACLRANFTEDEVILLCEYFFDEEKSEKIIAKVYEFLSKKGVITA